MSERSLRWGVLPRYFGYRGDVIETQPETEAAILAAMGVAGGHPPPAPRPAIPAAKSEPPPSRAPAPAGMQSWVRGQGRALEDYATFSAITESLGPAWRSWPAELQHPRSEAVATIRGPLAGRVAFHQWLQFPLDRQLARASKEIGLITDVPVGFAADGCDAWRWQDLLAPDMRVGAPPDYFFPDGQDWGMPPFDPWNLRKAHFEPFF